MADWIDEEREQVFPFLKRQNYEKTSEETPDFQYNCVAFAVGRTDEWVQPPDPDGEEPHWTWPKNIPTDGTVASYVKLFESHGFNICDPRPEDGYERIALFANRFGLFSHVARQLSDGNWSSKLGEWEDIKHDTLEVLTGVPLGYGFVEHVMKRKIL